MKKKRLFLIIGGVIILAVAAVITISALKEDKITVHTGKVERKTIVQTVQATGKVEPVLKIAMSAYVSAEIVELPVVEGQTVKKDDLLCVLDAKRYKANRDQARASKQAAKSRARLARANQEQAERTLSGIFDEIDEVTRKIASRMNFADLIDRDKGEGS